MARISVKIQKVVEETVSKDFGLYGLTIRPGRLDVTLRARLPDGSDDSAYPPQTFSFVDDPGNSDSIKKNMSSILSGLILGSIVPNTKESKVLGIDGLTVLEAGILLIQKSQ